MLAGQAEEPPRCLTVRWSLGNGEAMEERQPPPSDTGACERGLSEAP